MIGVASNRHDRDKIAYAGWRVLAVRALAICAGVSFIAASDFVRPDIRTRRRKCRAWPPVCFALTLFTLMSAMQRKVFSTEYSLVTFL